MAPKGGFELKTPKGTRDWDGKHMVLREQIFDTIREVFKRHGGVTIDTPVFELKEILAGKYGEDSKLIYDLADQGGELCSLRYDLTVPFARFVAQKNIQQIKRYHIAKVYRRDQPAVSKGRMREFYQCDFDIAGAFDPMLPDAEIIKIVSEVFEALGWDGRYTIKTNHRKILDGIFQVCGVPEDKIRTISSAVDKLDKMPWANVKNEMVNEKGLDEAVADKIGVWVQLKGGKDLLEKLQQDESLAANESMKQGMADMQLLFDYLECFDATKAVSFDLSLARGLDYYTGIIYEVVTEGSAPAAPAGSGAAAAKSKSKPKKKGKASEDDDRSDDPTLGVGSVAAGGRYDNLVGMFSGKGQIPCVGISFGVDRIFSIEAARMAAEQGREPRNNETDVYVMAFGGKGFDGMVKDRMRICNQLWSAGIKAEFLYKNKPKLQNRAWTPVRLASPGTHTLTEATEFKAAENNGVPFAVILGEEELANGQVKLKQMGLDDGHPEKEGILVSIPNLVSEVDRRLEHLRKLEEMTVSASGLRVVDGIKGESVVTGDAGRAAANADPAVAEPPAALDTKPESAP
ncbi:histidyl-tRNA synthetase [Diaporthe helianthi]|uniref:histidine--tRNA ligase n=1 Tax=Diaporthe helianthi TaxID=158607 RepID=A0A2P5HMW5_DIAHE|nr:histidyl-tRNA synthetase [Diaporthe helianthi]